MDQWIDRADGEGPADNSQSLQRGSFRSSEAPGGQALSRHLTHRVSGEHTLAPGAGAGTKSQCSSFPYTNVTWLQCILPDQLSGTQRIRTVIFIPVAEKGAGEKVIKVST